MAKTSNKTPGSLVQDHAKKRGLQLLDVARGINVHTNRLSAAIKGAKPIDADLALRLAKFFGTTKTFFLDAQKKFELKTAEEENKGDIAKIKKYVKPTKKAAKAAADAKKKPGRTAKKAAAGAKKPGRTAKKAATGRKAADTAAKKKPGRTPRKAATAKEKPARKPVTRKPRAKPAEAPVASQPVDFPVFGSSDSSWSS